MQTTKIRLVLPVLSCVLLAGSGCNESAARASSQHAAQRDGGTIGAEPADMAQDAASSGGESEVHVLASVVQTFQLIGEFHDALAEVSKQGEQTTTGGPVDASTQAHDK